MLHSTKIEWVGQKFMSDKREIKRVFIASPSDVRKEREIFRDVIEQVNSESGERLKIRLEALGWEDTMPGKGRPQALINNDIEKSDLVIFVLWKRWGSPTGEYSSGFEEEFELANKFNEENYGRPEILLYFRSVSSDMLADPGEQLANVIKFRNRIEEGKKFLYKQYETEDQWRDLFREHLYSWLHKTLPTEPASLLPAVVDERLNELIQSLDKAIKGRLAAAQALADSGRITEAEVQFAQAASDHPNNPAVLNRYGTFLLRIGLLDKAEKTFHEVLNVSEQNGEPIFLATAHANLGIVFATRGHLDKALKMYEKSLVLFEELGIKEYQANCYGNLGNVYETRGDLDKAVEMHGKSLELNQELSLKAGLASNYGNLGNVYQMRSDLDNAVEMYDKSQALFEELGNKEGLARGYGNLGIICGTRGDLGKAVKMFEKSIELNEGLGRKEGLAINYANLGNAYRAIGEFDKAVKVYEKSLTIFEELGNKLQIEKTRNLLTRAKKELTLDSA